MEQFDISLFWNPLVLAALWNTVWISVLAQVFAIVLGIPMGAVEVSRFRVLRWLAWTYNWIFQGTPLLLQLIFFWAVLPLLGVRLPAVVAGLLALTLHETARMSQVVRASLVGVPRDQADAARVLGMRGWHIARYITAPQAIRLALPSVGNELNYMLKASSQLAAIAIIELTRQTQIFTNRDPADPVQYYLVALVYYLALSLLWRFFQTRLERAYAQRGFSSMSPESLITSRKVKIS